MSAKEMTRAEALAEATRRHAGDLRTVWVRWFYDSGRRRFQVGYDHISHGRFRTGIGASWEEALADADRRSPTPDGRSE